MRRISEDGEHESTLITPDCLYPGPCFHCRCAFRMVVVRVEVDLQEAQIPLRWEDSLFVVDPYSISFRYPTT